MMHSETLFFKRNVTIFKIFENRQIFDGTNNEDIFVVVCIPSPELNKRHFFSGSFEINGRLSNRKMEPILASTRLYWYFCFVGK